MDGGEQVGRCLALLDKGASEKEKEEEEEEEEEKEKEKGGEEEDECLVNRWSCKSRHCAISSK